MIKRICPVCEQIMEGRHYCPVCRSFIKHPNFIEADYYLNERHPSFEKDCEYHNPSFGGAQTKKKQAAVPNRSLSAGQGAHAGARDSRNAGRARQTGENYGFGGNHSPARNYGPTGNKGNPAASAIIIIMVIFIMMYLLTAIVPFLLMF